MKFRYYITDTFEGEVHGTNNENIAKHLATEDEYFVVDTETGSWLNSDGNSQAINDFDTSDVEEDEG